jgi:hypothetical protein
MRLAPIFFFFSVRCCLEELFSNYTPPRFYERFSVPLRLGDNWGYWPSDSVFDQGGGVHHKLLMFLTWMGSFACHWHWHQVKGTSVLRPSLIRRPPPPIEAQWCRLRPELEAWDRGDSLPEAIHAPLSLSLSDQSWWTCGDKVIGYDRLPWPSMVFF